MKQLLYKTLWLGFATLIFAACKNGGEQANNAEKNEIFNRPDLREVTKEIKSDPKNARLYFKRGAILHRFNQDSLAIDDFKKAISLDSSRAEYYSAVGQILFDHKDISSSVKWIQKAIELNPQDPVAHLKMAKMQLFIKEYPKSLNEINIVLRQDPYNPEGYFLKGMVYKDLKDTSKAISSFQTALNVAPDYKDAMIQLGQVYAAQNNPLALKYYENAYKRDTTDVYPLFAQGVYYHHAGDDAKAKELYRECIRRDHQYADAYYNMGYLFIKEDSIDKAFRQFDLITKIDPTDAEAYYNRGLCYAAIGKKKEAADDFKQALVFDKNYKEAREQLQKLGAHE